MNVYVFLPVVRVSALLHKLIVGSYLPVDPFPEAIAQSLKRLGNAPCLCGPRFVRAGYFNSALVRWVVDIFARTFVQVRFGFW